jgi:hypothetical protein
VVVVVGGGVRGDEYEEPASNKELCHYAKTETQCPHAWHCKSRLLCAVTRDELWAGQTGQLSGVTLKLKYLVLV